MHRLSRIPVVLAGVAAAVALTACGSDDDPDTTATNEPAATQPAEQPGDQPGADGTTVELADTDLGQILVDGDGRTLYLFTNDTRGSGQSSCEGDCLTNWPAVEGELTPGDGIDPSLVGTIQRTDGTTQATYNDWPLYYFAADANPGDTNGQGVNDVWFVVGPDGKAVKATPQEDTESSGYGY